MRTRDHLYVLWRRSSRRAFKQGFSGSMTILWARLIAVLGFVCAVIVPLIELAGAPGIQENVTALLDPKYVPYYLIVISLVTEIARRRTLRD